MRLFFVLLFLIACQSSYQKKINNPSNNHIDNFFINANKTIIQNEELKIDSILESSTMSFVKHHLGIRFFLEDTRTSTVSAEYPKDGDLVIIEYSCHVFDDLNDLMIDNIVDTLGFQIGYSKQMRGLNYAIKLLSVGDKAKIIIPSYLGFGMSGYGKVVPPYSTLVLNVKLLNIE
tara:strand:- start:459 stop:983 length:525 start_codon:yes stop_codon:yes gene_type:complete